MRAQPGVTKRLVVLLSAAGAGAAPSGLQIAFQPPRQGRVQVRDTVTSLLLTEAPRIDGDLSDEVWREAAKIPLARDTATGKATSLKTTVWIGHRKNVLYVAANCETGGPGRRPQAMFDGKVRDRPVWHDDCIELLFDTNHDHRTFDAVVVNCMGAVADFRYMDGSDRRWNAPVTAAAQRRAGAWSVELAISPKSFSDPGNGIWGFNVLRRLAGSRSAISWNPAVGKVRDAGRFGHLSFEQDDCYIRSASFGTLRRGENMARVSVVNRQDVAMEVDGVLAIGQRGRKPKKTQYKLKLRPKRTEVLGFPFNVPRPATCSLALGIVDPKTRRLLCGFTRRGVTAVQPLQLEPVTSVTSAVVMRVRLGLPPREVTHAHLVAALRKQGGGVTLATARATTIKSRRATVTLAPTGLAPGVYEIRVTLAAGPRVMATTKHAFRVARPSSDK